MTSDPSSARAILESAVGPGDVVLDDVVEAADVLSRASSGHDDGALIARALRATLTRGLDQGETGRADALATYARLAARFRAWIDVWNATSLAIRLGATDPKLRALRTVAFVNVFDAVARKRPELVQKVMGGSPDARSGTFVLLRWLDRITETTDPTRDAVELAEALHAVLACRDVWLDGPAGGEVDRAWSDLAVDLARQVTGPPGTSPAWATIMTRTARLLAERLDSVSRSDDEMETAIADDASVASPAKTPAVFDAAGDIPDDIVRSSAAAIERDRRRIWVVGAHAAHHHLVGIAKELGFEKPSEVFTFMGYDDVKSKSLPAAIDPARDVGVILGAVPHKVKDVGSHSSLATALVEDFGLDVVPVRKNSTSGPLAKISKSQFRKALRHLLASAAPPLVEGAAA